MAAERMGKAALSRPQGCSRVDWLYSFISTFPAAAFPKELNIPPELCCPWLQAEPDLVTSHLSLGGTSTG